MKFKTKIVTVYTVLQKLYIVRYVVMYKQKKNIQKLNSSIGLAQFRTSFRMSAVTFATIM